ncbi:MAG: 4Fe-4S ferredoxin [Desulfotomaculales bacterium]
MGTTEKIREIAAGLLRDGKVDVVIGYGPGTLPLRSTPLFARTVEEAERLIWDATCGNNLAVYLPGRKDRVGIVVKGCDSRAVVQLIHENQIAREQVFVIGVPCAGIIDRRQVEAAVEREITVAREEGPELVVEGDGWSRRFNREEVLYGACRTCRHNNPVLYDALAGEPLPPRDGGPTLVEVWEKKPAEERRDFILSEMARCIRCYACRNACPMCYCTECFVDCSTPRWLGRATDAGENLFFQIGRVFHLAGRCVACVACSRACPMDIKLGLLLGKMNKDVLELFGHEAGLNPEEPPALNAFRPDDPETFLLGK